MRLVFVIFSMLFAISCAHKTVVSTERAPAQSAIETIKPEDITIWSLQDMARQKKFDVLNDLFNNKGIKIDKLPEGYAAGAAARVMGGLGGEMLDSITGNSWKGKMFFPAENPRKSKGLNRIREGGLFGKSGAITPMASFETELLERDPLTPEAKSNVVILNYAKPITKGYWQEKAINSVPVYDVMVPIKGRSGTVFVGKTWIGLYEPDGSFTSQHAGVAWFFLDFNNETLRLQKEEHWDGSKEVILNPLPKVKN